VRLHYVRRKRGNLFWEPTPAMRDMGFQPMPLGPEGAASVAKAAEVGKQRNVAEAKRMASTLRLWAERGDGSRAASPSAGQDGA